MLFPEILKRLERRGSKRNVAGMARYGITSRARVLGVSVGTLRALAQQIGRDHALAAALWKQGWYESRMLAAFVDEPERVTVGQMNRWAGACDNWAICDTLCFHLFDRSPLAWGRLRPWAASPREFVKRAAFALIASLALHDKASPDQRFRALLPLVARGAKDPRNFVKKGVSWALRGIGHRSPALRRDALVLAQRLIATHDRTARWVGSDAVRDLKRG